ncbi:MAG TPA: ABC transporter ATP-binding protein [Actinomycetota bacterium]|nr:ABC transporter ATP-binding protein [Actinomycetota bacterium]
MDQPLISVRNLETHFASRGSFAQRLMGRSRGSVHAVDDVTLDIAPGEVFGLVGESGSGKTTLGRTLLKLAEPTAGTITFEGTDITDLDEDEMRPLRRRMQVVYQDPNASLNPAMRIVDAVAHPLKIHGLTDSRAQAREEVVDILEKVGLSPAENFLEKYPDDLSGGQKQRVAIARALITSPSFLVLDEPVAMLDMSVRARVLELLIALRNEFNLTYLFITHDLATAKFLCDRIAIMYLGKIVEIGPAHEVYATPKHPYTQALLAAIPQPDPRKRELPVLPRGEIPDSANPPSGCRFHPRCPQAVATCGWEPPDLADALEERWAGTSEDRFETERALLAPMAIGDRSVTVPAGEHPEEVKRVLEAVLASRPGMRDAVGGAVVEGTDVIVRFPAPEEPPLRPVAGHDVACVLYPT